MRCRNCSRCGCETLSRSSGWPTSTICKSLSDDVSRFDSIRNSSSTLSERFCASSMITTTSRSSASCWIKNWLIASSIVALSFLSGPSATWMENSSHKMRISC